MLRTKHIFSAPLRFVAFCFVGAMILSTQLGSGCETTPEDDRYDDRYDNRYPPQNEPYYDENRIPSDARLMTEGRGEIGFRAGSSGRVWVFDEKDRKTVYTTDLLDGDDFRVIPDDNRIFINDRSKKSELKRDHVHRIYFDGRRSHSKNERDDRDRDDHRKPDEPKRLVPDSAKMVAETSHGGELSFKAANNGKAYLYDNSNNVLVETFSIKKNQRLTINVSTGLGTIDGKQVMKKGLSQRATYRLLFAE